MDNQRIINLAMAVLHDQIIIWAFRQNRFSIHRSLCVQNRGSVFLLSIIFSLFQEFDLIRFAQLFLIFLINFIWIHHIGWIVFGGRYKVIKYGLNLVLSEIENYLCFFHNSWNNGLILSHWIEGGLRRVIILTLNINGLYIKSMLIA